MKRGNRKSIWDDLNRYDYMAKKDSFIEITEWTNGEGWDISVDGTQFNLTHGQLDAINYLTKALEYEDSE